MNSEQLIQSLTFEGRTLKVLGYSSLSDDEAPRNVHCFDADGRLMWKIQAWPLEKTGFFSFLPWVHLYVTDEGQLRAATFHGTSAAVSPIDGSLSDFDMSRS